MKREDLADLTAFAAVAEARSFTRAAAGLGMSPSALSHAMRVLEARLGVRLLARTTRSVATTEAGERLLQTVQPALRDIAAGLASLSASRDTPSGTVRITTFKHAAASVLRPALPAFLERYPNVRVEVAIDEALVDLVANRFDAGIRFGEKVAKDMIAVRIGPDIRSAVVAAPAYFARYPAPAVPGDLAAHRCINHRLATSGSLYVWEFERAGRAVSVRVEGPLVFNDSDLSLAAALDGLGVAYLFWDQVADHVAAGRLVPVLADWCWTAPGYCLYYPNRRQTPPALAALVDALRRPAASSPPSGR